MCIRDSCYTFAWNALLNFALLNLAGLAWAAATGQWRMKQIYAHGYTPLLIVILLLGAFGILPRVRRSTQGDVYKRQLQRVSRSPSISSPLLAHSKCQSAQRTRSHAITASCSARDSAA